MISSLLSLPSSLPLGNLKTWKLENSVTQELGILPIMLLVLVIPVLSLAIPGPSLAIPGLSLLVPSQFQDVPDSSCLTFYQQYINSYNKLNILGTII